MCLDTVGFCGISVFKPYMGEFVVKKHLPYDYDDQRELFDDSFHAASVSECTGLIPTAPCDNSEILSYSQLYDIPLPNLKNRRRESMSNSNGNKYSDEKRSQNVKKKNQSTSRKSDLSSGDSSKLSDRDVKSYNG